MSTPRSFRDVTDTAPDPAGNMTGNASFGVRACAHTFVLV